jgi:hypothetical protein
MSQTDPKERILLTLRELQFKRIPAVSRKSALTTDEVTKVSMPAAIVAAASSVSRQQTSPRERDGDLTNRHHYLRSTLASRERTQSCSSPDALNDSQQRRERPQSPIVVRDAETINSISNRLYSTQLRVPTVPKPPPCIAASSARRADFVKRHTGSAPIRRSIADEPYAQHFFLDGQRHKIDAAAARDKQDVLTHDKMHHTIDKGTKFDAASTEELVRRLKEDALKQKERDHDRLTDKYVDRIRKRGCPQPPGRRRHRQQRSSPKAAVAPGGTDRDATVSP